MAFSGKIYVAYDGKNDLEYANRFKQFNKEDGTLFDFIDGFDFYSQIDKVDDELLKSSVIERVKTADVCCVLMGPTTKAMRKYIRWQVEGAINLGMPIIIINENNIRAVDFDRTPMLIKKSLALFISFNEKVLECSLDNWPAKHRQLAADGKKGLYKLPTEVYLHLGLDIPALE